MEADPYSCYYMEKNNCKLCVMKLKSIPKDIVNYVNTRAPNIDPFDWWWTSKSNDKESWIELTIRAQAVSQLEKHNV